MEAQVVAAFGQLMVLVVNEQAMVQAAYFSSYGFFCAALAPCSLLATRNPHPLLVHQSQRDVPADGGSAFTVVAGVSGR